MEPFIEHLNNEIIHIQNKFAYVFLIEYHVWNIRLLWLI